MVYLFVLAVGFLTGVFATCLLLAFWERDTRRAGDVINLTGMRPIGGLNHTTNLPARTREEQSGQA